ncbi:MAG: hypothetical protein B5M53_05990 [Candidatus Cloacimonas sp. 4484_209]|nr:MAG: hypothetical protein B5M53_05990 [Candidatus Cloacimonas sp. 4484_209]
MDVFFPEPKVNKGGRMRPIIGVNMDFSEYGNYQPNDLRFRNAYKIYTPYVDAVEKYGGIVLPIPPLEELKALDDYVKLAQGFIFSGGDDYPSESYNETQHPASKIMHRRRADADLYLARKVLKTNKPILAICGGIQLINIIYGGKLIQHLNHLEIHNKRNKTTDNKHKIKIVKNSLLYQILKKEELEVNSAHHQAADPRYIGKDLMITATASDGIVEALELRKPEGRFFLAVQWHPERMDDEEHKKLIFSNFINAAAHFSPL